MTIGQVVAEVRRTFPDVSHSSLRFLEREGLLFASRTPGGHRLYTVGDVERIRKIKQWQEQRFSLSDIRDRLFTLDRLSAPSLLAEECLHNVLVGDLDRARRSIVSASDAGLSLERIFGDVIQPVLTEVGRRWQLGDLAVAQEKEISELMREVIIQLTLRSPIDASGPVLVAACVEGERHELGLRMLCGLLRTHGYDVHFLGADVAPQFLRESTERHRPIGVLLSASMPQRSQAVDDAIVHLTSRVGSGDAPAIIVGGQGVAEHAETIRGLGASPILETHPAEVMRTLGVLFPPLDSSEHHQESWKSR